MSNVEGRYGPVIEVFEVEGTRERRLVIGYKMGDTTNFFRLIIFYILIHRILTDPSSALSNLYHFYSLYSSRKYVGKLIIFLASLFSLLSPHLEQFSNGITIISLYLNPLPNSVAPPIESSIFQVMKEASLLFCLPDNPYFLPKSPGSNAVQEATYACASLFPTPVKHMS
jgi:glutamate dehydrogenase